MNDLMNRSSVVKQAQSSLLSRLAAASNQVTFDYADGMIVLRGNLRSYYQKQLAQEAVRKIEGIKQIHNEIVVDLPA